MNPLPSSASIGRTFRIRRESRGLSLAGVALRARIPVADLDALESGRRQPPIAELQAVARVLGTTLAELVKKGPAAETLDTSPMPLEKMVTMSFLASAILALPDPAPLSRVEAVVGAVVLRAIEVSKGNQSAAARLLGMERKAFMRRLARAKRAR